MKRVIFWVLVGWGIAFLITPQQVVGMFRKRG